jgi:hypothetical protein
MCIVTLTLQTQPLSEFERETVRVRLLVDKIIMVRTKFPSIA